MKLHHSASDWQNLIRMQNYQVWGRLLRVRTWASCGFCHGRSCGPLRAPHQDPARPGAHAACPDPRPAAGAHQPARRFCTDRDSMQHDRSVLCPATCMHACIAGPAHATDDTPTVQGRGCRHVKAHLHAGNALFETIGARPWQRKVRRRCRASRGRPCAGQPVLLRL